MLRTALTTALAHKARLALTSIAIMLGVAFVTGSLVFTDTIQARFDTLFADVYDGVDASVRAEPDGVASGVTTQVGSIPQTLGAEILARDDVAAAEGYVQAFGQVIDADGEPVGGMGAPTYVYSWIDEPDLNPFRITDGDGRAPGASGEVVVDVATADLADLSVGDRVGIQFPAGTETFDLVGVASFGDTDNLAGATITVVPLPDAQRILGMEGRVSFVDVVAAEGVDPARLVDRLGSVVPDGVEVVTGDQQTAEAISGFTEGLAFMSAALLGFAAVAVLVGAFIIHNTFRIVVAQRTRELALLRALGASSRQVIGLVLAEALVVATLASAVGVGLGIGVSELIQAGMDAVGFGPPEGPLTLAPRTFVVAMTVGVLVTALSALLPAVRASRVPPVAAMGATTARSVERPARVWLRVALLVAGTGAVAAGLAADQVALTGAGAALAVIALLTLAPMLTRPVASVLGRPVPGVVGQLARENTARDPRRTSATASALMIGIALVVFTAIFAASTKESISASLEESFPGDLTVAATNPFMAVSADAQDTVAAADGVAIASPVRMGTGLVDGAESSITAVVGATIDEVYNADTMIALGDIGTGVLVAESVVADRAIGLGDTVTVALTSETSADLTIVGTHGGGNLGDYVVDASTWDELGGGADAAMMLVALDAGSDVDEGSAAVEEALARFPSLVVQTTSQQIAAAVAQVDAFLVLFTGLLAMALLIAVLGIANTLVLSIVERTREIGLLRAVGLSRAQVRWMITSESVVTALFGAVVGSAVGMALGWVVVTAFGDQGLGTLAIPVTELVVWLALAALAGVVAAALPARKAARLDVLRAIAYE